MTVSLFHHPDAGEGGWSADRIMSGLREAGVAPVYVSMDEPGWEEALAGTDELAIVAGGDGSVSCIATRLGGRPVPIAILPTGSGNNIARSLGVLFPLAEAIERIAHAATAPMRVCHADGPWGSRRFVEAVGIGALAQATADLQDEELDGDEKRRIGRQGLIDRLRRLEPLEARVTVDGEAVAGSLLCVEVLNLPMIGANLRMVPDQPLADDRLTVATLPESARAAAVDWLQDGAHGVSPFPFVRGRIVKLAGRAQPLRLEDKSLDWDGSEVTVTVEPARVQVVRPGDLR